MAMKTDVEKGFMGLLGITVVIATFVLVYILLTKVVPPENKDIVNVALGAIFGLSAVVVNYYFGSSKSSSDKTFAEKEKLIETVEVEENAETT